MLLQYVYICVLLKHIERYLRDEMECQPCHAENCHFNPIDDDHQPFLYGFNYIIKNVILLCEDCSNKIVIISCLIDYNVTSSTGCCTQDVI
jgi:hypothetical protein